MPNSKSPYFLIAGVIVLCGCFLFAALVTPGVIRFVTPPTPPAPSLFITIPAVTPTFLFGTPPAPGLLITVPALTPTVFAPITSLPAAPKGGPSGHIFFTCEIYKFQSSEQICIMNADGSGYRRLTTEDNINHYYASPSRDGTSVVYSAYRADNVYEIYEISLADGTTKRLTDKLGILNGPAISPDGKSIVFSRSTAASNQSQLWVMDRNGGNPRRFIDGSGWDPVWSSDGSQILYATDRDGSNQLWIVNVDGRGLHQVTHLPSLRGRSDWSPQNLIVTYSGDAGKRELYIMGSDGSKAHQISPSGGNSQGPGFSPDGQWIAFTAYFDHPKDINGCQIYLIRADGTDLHRLTNSDYCNYQPRWGP